MNLYISPTANEKTHDPSNNRTEQIPVSAAFQRPLHNIPFCPISAEASQVPVSGSNFNPRNTNRIPVVKIFAFLELEQNWMFFKGLSPAACRKNLSDISFKSDPKATTHLPYHLSGSTKLYLIIHNFLNNSRENIKIGLNINILWL